jgi:hypothetical protein
MLQFACFGGTACKRRAPVAQLDRASDSDSEGHAFEPHRAYHQKTPGNEAFPGVFAYCGIEFMHPINPIIPIIQAIQSVFQSVFFPLDSQSFHTFQAAQRRQGIQQI